MFVGFEHYAAVEGRRDGDDLIVRRRDIRVAVQLDGTTPLVPPLLGQVDDQVEPPVLARDGVKIEIDMRIQALAVQVLMGSSAEVIRVVPEIGNIRNPRNQTTEFLTLDHLTYEQAGNLSGGQQRLLEIGMALMPDPDLILLGDSMFGITIESVIERAGWDSLTAVQNGQIFPFNDDLVSRSGPRMVDGLEEMAKVFFPELFE